MKSSRAKWPTIHLAWPAVLIWAAPAAAVPGDFIAAGRAADPPAGFVQMCARDAVLCRAGLPQPEPVAPAAPPSCWFTPANEPSGWPRRSVGVWSEDGAWSQGCAAAPVAVTASIAPVATPTMPIVGLPVRAGVISGTAALMSPSRRDARAHRADRLPKSGGEARLVSFVNTQVNRQVVSISDLASRGVEEEWDRPGRVGRPPGDCEDYAIEKRMRLVEAGFAPDRLFFAVVYRPNFGLHTVLVARLATGDVVLDSARADVVSWAKSRYVWLRVQSPKEPMHWTTIGKG